MQQTRQPTESVIASTGQFSTEMLQEFVIPICARGETAMRQIEVLVPFSAMKMMLDMFVLWRITTNQFSLLPNKGRGVVID